MPLEFIVELEVYLQRCPLSNFRRVEWFDTAELSELFRSESLETYYGKFFDQRYIDYLFRNFEAIDRIN